MKPCQCATHTPVCSHARPYTTADVDADRCQQGPIRRAQMWHQVARDDVRIGRLPKRAEQACARRRRESDRAVPAALHDRISIRTRSWSAVDSATRTTPVGVQPSPLSRSRRVGTGDWRSLLRPAHAETRRDTNADANRNRTRQYDDDNQSRRGVRFGGRHRRQRRHTG